MTKRLKLANNFDPAVEVVVDCGVSVIVVEEVVVDGVVGSTKTSQNSPGTSTTV